MSASMINRTCLVEVEKVFLFSTVDPFTLKLNMQVINSYYSLFLHKRLKCGGVFT